MPVIPEAISTVKGTYMSRANKAAREVLLTGYIEEYEADDNDDGLRLATEDEEYYIKLDRKGKELFDYVDEEVQVKGQAMTDDDGLNWIAVKSFDVIAYDDDDDEYDDNSDDFDQDRYIRYDE
jgi:hypothetical protein